MPDSPKQPVTPSQFNMIRCILAVAHADGEIQEEEKAFITKMLSKLSLSDEQQAVIDKEFKQPQDVITIFDQIEDPKFKSQVIHFARLMAWKDNKLDPSEKEIIAKLQQHASKGAGHDNIQPFVTDYMRQSDNNPDFQMSDDGNSKTALEKFFDRLLLR